MLFVAVAAYLNSLGNGFAYDDNAVVLRNDVVTEGRWGDALLGPYWPESRDGAGLYRPVTVTALAAEWRLWKGDPLGLLLFPAAEVIAKVGITFIRFVENDI